MALQTKIKPMRKEDVSEVVKGWNENFVFDRVGEEKFEDTIFNDLNYEPNSTLVAIDEEKITGFASCAAREGILGKDGVGTEEEKDIGYIKGMFYQDADTGQALLEKIEEYMLSKGKKGIRVADYHGVNFFPGIDLRFCQP